MATVKAYMGEAQKRYKLYFVQSVILLRKKVIIGSHIFMSKDLHSTETSIHKLAQFSTGPHLITEVDYKTSAILRDNKVTEIEQLDRVLLAPDIGTTESEAFKPSPLPIKRR